MSTPLSIRERENELFESCKAYEKVGFVPDGMVCEAEFNKAPIKILGLFKEVNDPEHKEKWDLRDFLEYGGRLQTWNAFCQWLKGIYAYPNMPAFECIQRINLEERKTLLQKIVVMNLKKVGGGSITNRKALAKVAEKDKDLLNKQFEFYDVDFVICCGRDVARLAKRFIAPIKNADDWKILPETGVKYIEFASRQFAISFYHPQQYRRKHNVVYEELVKTVRILRG